MANRYRRNPRYQTQQSDPKLDRLQQVMELGEPQRQDQAQRQGLALQLLEQLTGMQNARQRAAQGEAELGLQREAMQQRGVQDTQSNELRVLEQLAGGVGPGAAAAMTALQQRIPALQQAQQQITQQQTGEQVRQLNPVLSALYQQGTPERPVLDALKQTYPLGFESPDVPWDTLNQSLPQTQAGAGSRLVDFIASGAGIPKLVQNPQVQNTAKTAFDAIYEKFFNPALTKQYQDAYQKINNR